MDISNCRNTLPEYAPMAPRGKRALETPRDAAA
jgi:hypothetical protein